MKRALDLAIIALTAVAWLPVILFVAMLVWLTMGRPVLFVQARPGLHGRPFRLLKFRTMQVATHFDYKGNDDLARLTSFGRMLRSTSLDELPELWNVVKGDMSLVGPRPLLIEYLPLYSPEQARRHEVRPGITGWAQVNGRNAISWEERLRLDVWYLDNRSTWLDLRILGLTVCKVLRRDGISSRDEATMSKFTGSEL